MARKKKNFYDEDLNKIPVCIEPDEPFYGWHLDEYQLEFVNAMLNPENIAVFCNAKSGSGKTSLAVATANLLVKGGRFDKAIYCVRPARRYCRKNRSLFSTSVSGNRTNWAKSFVYQ